MPKVQAAEQNGGGRGRRGRRTSTSLAEINVVPLVDVMLVLLIIFMVTAPMMQRGVDVKLPTSRRASPMSSQRVTVTVPLSYRKDQRVLLGENDKEENVRIDLLAERVRQAMVSQTEKQVFLRLDAGITAQEFMNVIDRLKEAGVENIGLPTEFPSR
jgi:biopolymer transport protein TolR